MTRSCLVSAGRGKSLDGRCAAAAGSARLRRVWRGGLTVLPAALMGCLEASGPAAPAPDAQPGGAPRIDWCYTSADGTVVWAPYQYEFGLDPAWRDCSQALQSDLSRYPA